MTEGNKKETEWLKEVLGDYAEKELENMEGIDDKAGGGEDARKPGARLDTKMKRMFWYYGGGRRKLIAAAGVFVSLAAVLLLGYGIHGMQARRGRTPDIDTAGVKQEVYMDYYGEEAAIPDSEVMSQGTKDGSAPTELAELPFRQWSDLKIHTDADQAVRNSNYKSYGYLCTGDNGMIYFTDMEERAIYGSRADGSGRIRLADGAGNYLQERDGNLYYVALDEGRAIMRLNIASKEKTVLFDKPHGEFVLTDEGLLVNAEGGVFLLGYDDGAVHTIEAMPNTDWQPALFTVSEDYILFNAVQAADAAYYMQGYLLGYDRTGQEVSYLGNTMMRPLAAGDYLIAVTGSSYKESTLHVMDMMSGTDTDLGVWPYDGFVSDGKSVYYTRGKMLCRYRDGVNEELIRLDEYEGGDAEGSPNRYLFLAGEYLYWMTEVQITEDGELKETIYEWHSISLTE